MSQETTHTIEFTNEEMDILFHLVYGYAGINPLTVNKVILDKIEEARYRAVSEKLKKEELIHARTRTQVHADSWVKGAEHISG